MSRAEGHAHTGSSTCPCQRVTPHPAAATQDVKVADWVAHGLDLPQYAQAFRTNSITVSTSSRGQLYLFGPSLPGPLHAPGTSSSSGRCRHRLVLSVDTERCAADGAARQQDAVQS
jgi:hypothetical protein